MKKLFLSIAVLAATCMISCSSEKKAEDKGAELKAKIENCTNPDSLKIYVDQAKEYADKLIKEGKDADAETFINEIAPAVKAKDPVAAVTFAGLDLKAKADSAFEVVKDAADSTKTAVSDKVSDAKEAVSEKAEDVKDATKSAVDAAKTKTAEAAQAGADKVKDLMGK
ncbi:MAG: hypothetical protein NC212_06685 [Staphylococcus sp.]|nr:hypothetical protein [Staphylococcus sp.]